MHRSALTVLLVGLCGTEVVSVTRSAADSPQSKRPNIVFILADDLGWMDTSTYGSRFYRTPNVDRLARAGVRFTDAYAANPLCSPTRASILTGQFPGRLRFTTPAGHLKQEVLDPKLPSVGPPHQKAVTPGTRTRLPNTYFTIAEALKEAGYATGFFGKWHLGRTPYLPENQGFDVVVGGREHPGPPGGYFAPWPIDTIPESPKGAHICDVLTTEAIKFLEQHREGPFFLNLWFYDVHAPFQAKPDLVASYRDRLDPTGPQRCPTMGAMIDVMDQNLGRLLDALNKLGLAENTLIVFTSDNGGNMYDAVDGTTPTNNHPLRGGKATIYEGGVRVPLIAVWPGRIQRGSTSSAVVSSIDYYPTLLDALDLKPEPEQILDGVSIMPALRGESGLAREAVFCHFPHYMPATGNLPSTSVRKGDWKLIRFYADNADQTDRFELYDLRRDIGERNNLAGMMPDKVKELNALIDRHIAATRPLVPVPNPAYRPPIAGWYGSTDAELSLESGQLVVESTGNDPFIRTSDVPRVSRPASLLLRMKSKSRAGGRAYWATRARRAFHRGRSTAFDVKHDGQWHEYEVELRIAAPLTALRIDPSQGPGRIEVESIRLIGADREAIKQWRFAGPAAKPGQPSRP